MNTPSPCKEYIASLLILTTMLLSGCANLQEILPPLTRPNQVSAPPEGLIETPVPADTETPAPQAISVILYTPTPTVEAVISPTETSTEGATFKPASYPTSADEVPAIDPNTIYPDAKIRIFHPGPLSKVVSPFRVVVNLAPGADGKVRFELVGEDGRTLVRKITQHTLPLGHETRDVSTDLEFEISTVAEAGRLQVSVDDEFGNTTALASVDLILLSDGLTEENLYQDYREKIIIQVPYPDSVIQGEVVSVAGMARPSGNEILVAELVTQDGRILGSGLATVVVQQGAEYGIFATEIHITVTEPTRARLIVRERGDRIPGTVHITSLEVNLIP